MKISIILITWNAAPLLRNCLLSLKEIMERKDVEVIITDNGSQDDTVVFLKKEYPQVQLIELKENKGVAYARNRGLEKAKGKYLFILDNDTLASREAIEGMEAFMDSHPQAGICGCRLQDGEGLIQESCRPYPGLSDKLANLLKGKEYRYHYSKATRSSIFEPVYLIGACQFIRREAFEQAGLLDENIFYGPEDADFCLKVKKANWHIYYLPQYTITHLCQRMSHKKIFSKVTFKHLSALFYFYWKHKKII